MAPTLAAAGLPNEVVVARFEKSLILGDSKTLEALNFSDGAAVARGDFRSLTTLSQITSSQASRIAHEVIACSDSPTKAPLLLHDALRAAADGSVDDLVAAYVAGVGLLQAFVAVNWTGPAADVTAEAPNAHDAAAALLLSLGGEDVARPAKCLSWLRAARRVLVESVGEFTRCGAKLAPWWAARVLLAHQGVLSGLAPELRYAVFTMFGRFLGADVAKARELYVETSALPEESDDGDDDDWLLPAPAADGEDIRDEELDFVEVFDAERLADRKMMTLAYLELSLAQKLYYDGDGALESLKTACRVERIAFRVAGEMGVRMKFQTKPTAQLVARAFWMSNDNEGRKSEIGEDGDFGVRFPRASSPHAPDNVSNDADVSTSTALPLPRNVSVNDSDVLGYIQLTGEKESEVSSVEHGDESDEEGPDNDEQDVVLGQELEYLSPTQQALALGQAAVVRARNASHLLTKEEMAPYVNLVIQNASSPFGTSSVLQIRALMLRVSFERERGRFLERCMSQMEEIGRFVDDTMEGSPSQRRFSAAAERNLLLFASSVPPVWELKKELAISFGQIGLVKSAMEIFEKLEYWDELVDCHRLIGNLGAAEALVREQLELLDKAVLEDGVIGEAEHASNVMQFGMRGAVHSRAARRPRLLCVLGDVTRNKDHFETAWQESGCKYARAKRALGRLCVEREDWHGAVGHFREALAINSLFPDVWFSYGCAAMQIDDMKLAAHAFTRVVQHTPENGEAWNNLGRVLHELGKKKEALKALGEAAKVKRDSWRIWNNVVMLATEIRSSADIVRAMERLLELRGKDGVVSEAVSVAVAEVVRMTSSDDVEDEALVGPVCRKLLKVLGRCTALVSTNPTIWAAYAELHELVPAAGGSQKAFDCRLKQVRALIAFAEWNSDRRAFRHMVVASDALARNAMQTGNTLSIRAARLHVRSVIEQTSDDFKGDEGFSRLQEARDLLQADVPNRACET